MKFLEALTLMKNGYKAKLPSWKGYWYWDAEKETVMIHCKDGTVLDIRETTMVAGTLSNVCSDEWIIANEENTPVLGDEATFSFGDAIKYMKRGLKVKRKGWNGKNQYVRIVDHYNDKAFQMIEKEEVNGTLHPYFSLKNEQNEFIPWVPSTGDMLAEDWCFVD